MLLAGLDPPRVGAFDELFDAGGAPLDLAALGPSEVYITEDGAEALNAGPGSVLNIALGPGMLTPLTVLRVADGVYVSVQGTDVILMTALASVQGLLGRPGELSTVLISNRGDVFGGVNLTSNVVDSYRDHSSVGGSGLEMVPVKRDVVD